MAGTRVEPSKTNHGEITLDLSAAAGPAAGERQEDDQGRPEDRKTDGGGDGWEQGGRDGAGTSRAGALAHLPCCHTNGDTIRVGLKDGGGRFFFFVRGKRGDGGTETDQKGRLLPGKGWEWEDRYGPKWPAPVGVCGVFFFFFPPAFLLTPWEARGEGWWKVGTRGKGKWSCCGRP